MEEMELYGAADLAAEAEAATFLKHFRQREVRM